jgi:hypothetical protein
MCIVKSNRQLVEDGLQALIHPPRTAQELRGNYRRLAGFTVRFVELSCVLFRHFPLNSRIVR